MSISTGGEIPVFINVAPGTFVMYDGTATGSGAADPGATVATGYVVPTITQADIRHTIRQGENRMSEGGVITGFSDDGEELTCTFTLRPEGLTIANALNAARIPGLGYSFRFVGLPIIQVGSLADALNTGAQGTTGVWWYRGGGQITIGSGADGHGMITLELHRYPGITLRAPTLTTTP